MGTISYNLKRNDLTTEIAELEKVAAAVSEQKSSTIDPESRIRLETGYQKIINRIDELEAELDKLEKSRELIVRSVGSEHTAPVLENLKRSNIEKNIHRYDLDKATDLFRKIHAKYLINGGASLILLQDSALKKGDWCIKRINDEHYNHIPEEKKNYISIGLSSKSDTLGVLREIGNKFSHNVPDILNPSNNEIESCAIELVDIICKRLQYSSRIIIIQLNSCDLLKENQVRELIDYFWKNLIFKQQEMSLHRKGVQFLLFAIFENEAPNDIIKNWCCVFNQFNALKFIELKLQNWTKEHIKSCIQHQVVAFRNVNIDHVAEDHVAEDHVAEDHVAEDHVAEDIYIRSKKGLPFLVHHRLMEMS